MLALLMLRAVADLCSARASAAGPSLPSTLHNSTE
jgi:hypothetical protein